MNLPTLLTLLRIFVIPLVVVCYYLPIRLAHPAAALIFLLACITDWLDGYLARRYSLATPLGAFLDPIADKLLVAVVLVIVVGEGLISGLAIPAAVIVGREVAISGLREWMAEMGKRTSVAVTFVAKIKTALQMLALILLLWYVPGSAKWVLWLGTLCLWIAAVLTLWSMIIYIKLAWPDFKKSAVMSSSHDLPLE
jgi:CDP-diacylglycerol---glycerol-3-phosphate 3-phosphatidyltransferase